MRVQDVFGMTLVALDASIGADNRGWVQLARTTDGVVQNGGKKFEITDADLAAFAASIKANPGRVPVDYDHSFDKNGSSRAAGWVDASTVEVRNGAELWSMVEWTADAAKDIRSGAYRFFSPEIRFKEVKDGVLRKAAEFLAGALTNRPFFKDMASVSLAVAHASPAALREEKRLEFEATMRMADALLEDLRADRAVADAARIGQGPAVPVRPLAVKVDGVQVLVSSDTATLHDQAQALLAEQGVDPKLASQEQYLDAVSAVSRKPGPRGLRTKIDDVEYAADLGSVLLAELVDERLAEWNLGRPPFESELLRAHAEVQREFAVELAEAEAAQSVAVAGALDAHLTRQASIAARADEIVAGWADQRQGLPGPEAERVDEYQRAVARATAEIDGLEASE